MADFIDGSLYIGPHLLQTHQCHDKNRIIRFLHDLHLYRLRPRPVLHCCLLRNHSYGQHRLVVLGYLRNRSHLFLRLHRACQRCYCAQTEQKPKQQLKRSRYNSYYGIGHLCVHIFGWCSFHFRHQLQTYPSRLLYNWMEHSTGLGDLSIRSVQQLPYNYGNWSNKILEHFLPGHH